MSWCSQVTHNQLEPLRVSSGVAIDLLIVALHAILFAALLAALTDCLFCLPYQLPGVTPWHLTVARRSSWSWLVRHAQFYGVVQEKKYQHSPTQQKKDDTHRCLHASRGKVSPVPIEAQAVSSATPGPCVDRCNPETKVSGATLGMG